MGGKKDRRPFYDRGLPSLQKMESILRKILEFLPNRQPEVQKESLTTAPVPSPLTSPTQSVSDVSILPSIIVSDVDLTTEKILNEEDTTDDMIGDDHSGRSANELLSNVLDKHKTQENVVMDILELMLLLDSDQLPVVLDDLLKHKLSSFDSDESPKSLKPNPDLDYSTTYTESYTLTLNELSTHVRSDTTPPPPPEQIIAPLNKCAPPPLSSADASTLPTTPLTSRRVPPPPPPPPPPTSGEFGSNINQTERLYPKNKKTFPIRWVGINSQRAHDNATVWSHMHSQDLSTEERDVLELMFEMTEAVTPRVVRKQSDPETVQEAFLETKRDMALEILLSSFKDQTVDVVSKLECGGIGVYSSDLLTSLLQGYPTKEELELFLAMEIPPPGKVNRLCWEVAKRPQLKLRLELLVVQESLPSEVTQRLDDCKNLDSAFQTIRGEIITSVLHKCLQCGNFVNQGSLVAHAAGFRLSSLPDFLTTKAKNPSENFRQFADFLVRNMHIEDSDVDEVLNSLAEFIKLSTDDLQGEHKRISRSLAVLKDAVQSSGDDGLLQLFRSLEPSEKDLDRLASKVAALRLTEKDTLNYFCADKKETMTALSSNLTLAFKTIAEALKAMKCPLSRSQSFMNLTFTPSRLDASFASVKCNNSISRSIGRRSAITKIPSQDELATVLLSTPISSRFRRNNK